MLRFARAQGRAWMLVVFSTGTASAAPRMHTHVACVGDSVTEGAGVDKSKSYPTRLQVLLGDTVKVQNFGHSGATMLSKGFGDLPYEDQPEYAAATDFVDKAGAAAVVSVVLNLGANDSKGGNWEPMPGKKNDQQYLADYRRTVDHFLGLATKPVVYLVLPPTGMNPCCGIRAEVIQQEEIPLIKQVAMEKQLPLIDLQTAFAPHPDWFLDGVHPNENGYQQLAMFVQQGLGQEPGTPIYPSGGSTSGGSPSTAGAPAVAGSSAGGTSGGSGAASAGGGGAGGAAQAGATMIQAGSGMAGAASVAAKSDSGGCSVGNSPSPLCAWAPAGLALAALRRRRGRAPKLAQLR